MKKKLLILGLFITMFFLMSGCSSAGGYIRNGRKCFLSGNYEEAEGNFAAAIKLNPNRAEYYIDYGLTLTALGRYEDAITQFDRVYMDKDILMVKQNNERALRGKGIAYYDMQDYTEAIRQFDAALEIGVLSELDMDILYYKGNALLITGAYPEAGDTYTRIIDTFGNEAEALGKRAYTYLKTGEYDKCLADYDLAISLNPENYDFYFGKYDLLMTQQNEEGASEILAQASAIVAESKEDQYNLAKIHYYQRLYDVALAELSESFAQGFTEAYYYIGEIYAKEKDYTTAIYYYDKYIEEGEIKEPAVYNQAAFCKMKQGDYDGALKYLESGIGFGDAGAMKALKRNEIIAYEKLSRFDIAIGKLNDYLTSYPKEKEAERELEFVKTRNLQPDVLEEEE
jgi:tetratricopeptide (TPR) repeat protein